MKNILLIEDEDNLNRGISLKLQKEGYTVFFGSHRCRRFELISSQYD